MFGVLSFAAVALVAASTASAAAIPTHYPVPSTYDAKYLESYDDYHSRYVALDCQDKHNTAFFDSCCHPLLKGQSLSSRPKECTPSVTPTSTSTSAPAKTAALATGGGSADNNNNDDCEDGEGDDTGAGDEDCDDEGNNTSDNSGADNENCDDGDNGNNESTTTPSQPTTTPKPASTKPASTPKPTTTPKPTSTKPVTPPKPANTTPASSGDLITGGFATYFFQNGVAGACGTVHKDTDLIAAMDERRYGFSGAKSALCGKKVQITNPKNGKSVTVTVADDCPTCENSNSIDLSKSAFEAIAALSEGMVKIEWKFL